MCLSSINIIQTSSMLNIFKNRKKIKDLLKNNPYVEKYDEKKIGLDNVIYLLYCDYADALKWIKDAKKADIYFLNFDKASQILAVLSTYEWRHLFKWPRPSTQLNKLLGDYENYTKNFISRYWNYNLEAAQKLKTDAGKSKRIQRFFDDISTYDDRLTPAIREYVSTLTAKYEPTKIILSHKIKVGKYTLNSMDDILRINDVSVTRELQTAATDFKRMNKMDLAIACLRKSNDLSDHSAQPLLTQTEYMRVVKYLKYDKRHDEAESETALILKKHPEFIDKRISNLPRIIDTIRQNQKWGNDLVIVNTNNTCSVCKEYNNKIFSISGKSKKFSKLPKEISSVGGFCPNCYLGLLTYFDEITSLPK